MKRITYVAMPTVKKGYPAGPEQLSYGDGPELRQSAQIAHDQLISIMNFYNKDMFNQ